MILKVGNLDLLPFIVKDGIKWQRADLDGPNAGRMMNGDMQRDRVTTKIRWDITCRPLSPTELSRILTAIEPEYFQLTYTNPVTNSQATGTFYSNNFPATLYGTIANGTILWSGLTFPMIQK